MLSKGKRTAGNLDELPATQEAFDKLLQELKGKKGSAAEVEAWLASQTKELLQLMVRETLEKQEKA